MNPNEVQAVVFDCDGVMFDTTRANTAYYNHILNRFGKPDMTPAQFAFVHMHTVTEALVHLFDNDQERKAARAYRDRMSYHPFLEYMQIEPDLKALLEYLRPEYRTAIATNRTDTMPEVLKTHGLEGQFDLVVTALDVQNPKPHPEQLVKILNHFDLKPAQVIYIGDSEVDAAAAQAAEVLFAAYGNASIPADFHIQRLLEVKDILNGGS
jgi:HAD superfamily hydrolase (TIGR01549 family)